MTTSMVGPAAAVALGHLGRLAERTQRSRRRHDELLVTAELRCRASDARLEDARRRYEQRVEDERSTHERALASPPGGPDVDRGRRGVSTWAYVLVLLVGWLVNIPIGIKTFEIFEESHWFTMLLALLADTVLLAAAHAGGTTLRRAHLQADPRSGLGLEYVLGRALLLLGLGMTATQAWVRWQYLQLDGSGGGLAGVLFGTALVLVSFIVATWCAWHHYHPQVGDNERAARRLRRAGGAVRRVQRGRARCLVRLHRAVSARRHLAESVVSRAERIAAQFAASDGFSHSEFEPEWLLHERRLTALAMPESLMPQLFSLRPSAGGEIDLREADSA